MPPWLGSTVAATGAWRKLGVWAGKLTSMNGTYHVNDDDTTPSRDRAMPKPVNKNLHVPLSEPLYRRLRAEAERERRPATEIAREAID